MWKIRVRENSKKKDNVGSWCLKALQGEVALFPHSSLVKKVKKFGCEEEGRRMVGMGVEAPQGVQTPP